MTHDTSKIGRVGICTCTCVCVCERAHTWNHGNHTSIYTPPGFNILKNVNVRQYEQTIVIVKTLEGLDLTLQPLISIACS